MPIANNPTARGAFVQQASLNGLSMAGTDFVEKPVIDQSGWFAGQAGAHKITGERIDQQVIGASVEAGLQAAGWLGKGAVLHGVEQDTQALVDEYMDNLNVEQHGVDAMAYDNMSNSLWAGFGTGDSSKRVADISTVETKHREALNKISRAYKQGAITSLDELEARVLKVTREAVNRTPGMAQEIMGHTQQVLHLSGVRGMANAQQRLLQQEQKQMQAIQKNMISYANSNKIPFDNFNTDWDQLNQDINNHKRMHMINEQLSQAVKEGVRIEEHQMKEFKTKVFPAAAAATYDNVRAVADEVFSNGANYAEQKLTFKSHVARLKQQFEYNMQEAGLFADAEGARLHKQAIANIDGMVADLDSFESGADFAKHLGNVAAAMDSEQKMSAMKVANIHTAKIVGALSPMLGNLTVKEFAPQVQEQARQLIQMSLDPSMMGQYNIKDGVNDTTMTTAGMLLAGQPENVTKAFNSIALAMEQDGNHVNRVQKLTEHFKELGNDRYKGKIKNPDANFNGGFHRAAHVYMEGVGKMFQESINQANSTLGVKNADLRFGLPAVEKVVGIDEGSTVNARLKIGSSGFVSVESNGSSKQNIQWDKDVSARVNDVIKTYANIMNVTTKEASDVVLSRYGTMFNIPEEELPKVNAAEMIKKEEGFRTKAYLDSAGVPTIGFGFTSVNGKPVKMGDTMTREEALNQLEIQLPKYQTFKNKLQGVKLSEDAEAALTSFEYNLGSGIWDKGAKSILHAVQAGDFEHATSLMLQYDKARDPKTGKLKQVPGLSARRMREATMLAKAE